MKNVARWDEARQAWIMETDVCPPEPEAKLTRKERNALRRIKYGRTGSKTKHQAFLEACERIRAAED